MNFKRIFLSLSLALVISAFPSPAFADDVFTGNVEVAGDVAVNGGNITSNAFIGTLFNSGVGIIQIGNNASNISIGNYWGTIYAQGDLWIQKALNVNGPATFSPDWTGDVTVNSDSDSTLILNGLNMRPGDPLCLDFDNNVVKCVEEFARSSKQENSNLETIKAQQAEIDQLKKDVAELKAAVNH